MNDDTSLLAARAAQGDAAAVDLLLERFLPALRAFVRLRAGNAFRVKESTSDLVQSVCREVLQSAKGFREGGEKEFRNWLFTVAQRKIATRFEFYRAARRDAGREVPAALSTGNAALMDCYRSSLTPSRHAMAAEALLKVEAAFDTLTPDQREVILLARVVGLPTRDVAEQLGRTEGATRTLLSRALSRLAESLDGE